MSNMKESPEIKAWRENWENSVWECGITGMCITITPEMVVRGAFYIFGDSYVDLGDQYYCRMGGAPRRVE